MSERKEVKELSLRLNGMAYLLHALGHTVLSDYLIRSSKYLNDYANVICCEKGIDNVQDKSGKK